MESCGLRQVGVGGAAGDIHQQVCAGEGAQGEGVVGLLGQGAGQEEERRHAVGVECDGVEGVTGGGGVKRFDEGIGGGVKGFRLHIVIQYLCFFCPYHPRPRFA